jgi:hypothetical protein
LYLSFACFLAVCLPLLTGCGRQDSPLKDKSMQASVCATQLGMFANAKKLWAEQNNKTTNDTPAMEDLVPFIRCQTNCPGGGAYNLGKIGETPTCSIPEHQAAFVKQMQQQQAAAPAQ